MFNFFLKDISNKDKIVTIEPLSKFPIVKDLIVDRENIFKKMVENHLWLEKTAKINLNIIDSEYQSSKCLMCGCCLEICPNFSEKSEFLGALGMVNIFKLINQSPNNDHKNKIINNYNKNYYDKCGKSLSCHHVCPINLPIEEMLINSNRIIVWGKKL